MNIALQEETSLNMGEQGLLLCGNLFCDPEDADTEPVFVELCRHTGMDPAELEAAAVNVKLKNLMTPKEYKAWRRLGAPERNRIMQSVRSGREYKEFLHSCAGLVPTVGTMSAAQNPSESRIGRMEDAAGSRPGASGHTGNVSGQGGVKTAISAGQAAAEKTAKLAVRSMAEGAIMPADVSGRENGQERQILAKGAAGEKGALKAIKAAGTFLMEAGAYAIGGILILVLLAVVIAAVIFSQQKSSKNAGIMPYYAQADYAATPFNGKTIRSDGCGITSMAMVASLFKNEMVLPPALAAIAGEDASYNTVMSHGAIKRFASYYELGVVEEMAGPSRNCCGNRGFDLTFIRDAMLDGSPVIVSVCGGYYNPSGGGHYIALYGVGTNGVFVYDPGSRAKYRASVDSDGASWNLVFENAKHIWIFPPYAGQYLTGSSIEESVYLNLKQAGFSDAAAAGIIGNMYQECAHGAADLNPEKESKDGSVGLLQWTSGRRSALESLGRKRKKDWKDPAVQIEFLLQEMNGGDQWKWTGYAKKHYVPAVNISFEEFKQLSDPQRAAEVFQAKFVRPNYEKSNLEYRKSKAQEVFTKYAK